MIRALTPRESEVLGLLCTGLTAKRAARQLGLSNRTVEAHVRNARAKLGARTAYQAVALYVAGSAA